MINRVMRVAKTLLRKENRRWIVAAILLASLAFIIQFFVSQPEYIERLRRVSPTVILLVILINIPGTLALAWAYDSMLRLCGKPLPVKENVILTSYSSIINFFGPLQSGPGVRAVYLKTRHKVRVRDYLLATLVQYMIYASLSGFFLLAGVRPLWQTVITVIAIAGFSATVIRWFSSRQSRQQADDAAISHFRWQRKALTTLCIAVFLQMSSFVGYYFVELRAVDTHITFAQAVSYTGAASFAQFVSITPDAVGIREAFLTFSQQLHHVPLQDIINANVIDRGSYVLYLLILLAVMLSVHARDRLHLSSLRRETPASK